MLKGRKVKTIVKDLGWGSIMLSLAQLDNSYTKVGFPAEAEPGRANKKGDRKGHQAATKMSEVAMIAAFNEWGAGGITSGRSGGTIGGIPARPFMTTSFDENKADLYRLKERLYKQIIAGKINTPAALAIIGEWMTNKIKKKIRTLRTPPNHPDTIRRKKSSNPLIDFGQMINSVTHTETIRMGR